VLLDDADQPCGFGHGGLQQFVLDIRYVQAATRAVMCRSEQDKAAGAALREGLERAVVGYCMAFDEDIDTLLLSDGWHEQVIHKTMGAMASLTF